MSTAENAYALAGMFEAELLVELMLNYWNHPFAKNKEFRNELLEHAAEALLASIGGEHLIEGLAPSDMNLVAAVWYVEKVSQRNETENTVEEMESRRLWSQNVRRSVPSCFADPDDLV